jgi:hypothetical protein
LQRETIQLVALGALRRIRCRGDITTLTLSPFLCLPLALLAFECLEAGGRFVKRQPVRDDDLHDRGFSTTRTSFSRATYSLASVLQREGRRETLLVLAVTFSGSATSVATQTECILNHNEFARMRRMYS